MISILMLSWNRLETLKQTLPENLKRCGYPYEILICDQGSDSADIIRLLHQQCPNYLRLNSQNEGIAKALNQLYLRCCGDIVVTMPNDIIYPENWGIHFTRWLDKVPNSGLAAIQWGHSLTPPLSIKNGIEAHWTTHECCRVYGPTAFRRELVNQIGLFSEEFNLYGMEDSDLCDRATLAGFNNFYIPDLFAQHIGVSEHDSGEYRENKNKWLSENAKIFDRRFEEFKTKGIREPLPEIRPPL